MAAANATGGRRYRFGMYEADVRSGELMREGVKVKLQEQPFQILVSLLEKPGEIVTREEIQQRLWPADTFVDFDHGLNVAMKKLREALKDDAENPRFIETKPKRGYRFIAPVQVVGEEPGEEQVAPEPGATVVPKGDLPVAHRGWTRGMLIAIQALYLCFYVVALVRLRNVDTVAEIYLGGHGWFLTMLVLVTAMLGIPIRLYLLSAVAFDYAKTGEKFMRMFPVVLLLDLMWALSPLLSAMDIGLGLSLAVTAAMLYLPFSQRTLMRMTYLHS